MPNCQYINFDITILGNDAPYSVRARFDGHEATGDFSEVIDDPFWQEMVARFGDVFQPVSEDQIRAAGARLFTSLVAGDILRLWDRADSVIGSGGLRLRLAIQPPSVAALPWEALYDRNRSRLFAASGRTPLVRIENQLRYLPTPRALDAEPPLKVLVAAAEDPKGQINIELQAEELLALLRQMPSDLVDVHSLAGRFSVVRLAQEVVEKEIDVLHLISHGSADSVLLWHNDEAAAVGAGRLCAALERATSLRMVYLTACLAGSASEREAFTTVAPQLLQLGIPAVVAMQFPVSDENAAAFAELFYTELFTGPCPGAVDAALGYARSSQFALKANSFSFGTPVLWLHADDGVIFRLNGTEPISDAHAVSSSQTGADKVTNVDANIAVDTSANTNVQAAPTTEQDIPGTEELLAWRDALLASIDTTQVPPKLRILWPQALREYEELVLQLETTSRRDEKYADLLVLQTRLRNMAAEFPPRVGTHPPSAHGAT